MIKNLELNFNHALSHMLAQKSPDFYAVWLNINQPHGFFIFYYHFKWCTTTM